jgi:hypothetical protein
MYERIISTGRESYVKDAEGIKCKVAIYDVYSADMRSILKTIQGFPAALKFLKEQLLLERQCPSCED